jgi:hypothetical protein
MRGWYKVQNFLYLWGLNFQFGSSVHFVIYLWSRWGICISPIQLYTGCKPRGRPAEGGHFRLRTLEGPLIWCHSSRQCGDGEDKYHILFCLYIYRVIKKSLCTWRLQYRNLQVMLKVSPTSLQTFIDTRLTLIPSVIPNSNYVIMVTYWHFLKYFCVFFVL